VSTKPPRYSHAYTIAFEVETNHDAEKVTPEELLAGLQTRLDALYTQHALYKRGDPRNPSPEIVEACAPPYDTDDREEGEHDDDEEEEP
jgi:hypothetical protein